MLVLQASPSRTEKNYYTVKLPAVNARDEPLVPSHREDVKASHKSDQSNPPTNGILPDVRYNPQTLRGRWSGEEWARRALYDLGDYHILHAPSSDKGMVQNWFRPDLFQGDIFILEVAVTRSCEGPYIYDDILLNAKPDAETEFVEMLDRCMKERESGRAPLSMRRKRFQS